MTARLLPRVASTEFDTFHGTFARIYALGYRKAELIVGHNQGQLIATHAAIVRPDMFLRLTTVSSAGGAPPSFPVQAPAEMHGSI